MLSTPSPWIRSLLTVLILAMSSASVWADDCIRGLPEPAFKVGGEIRSDRFTRLKGTQAREQVVFKSGEKLTLEHGGCNYYVVGLRYEGQNLLGSDRSPLGVFKASAKYLRQLAKLKPNLSIGLDETATKLDLLVAQSGKAGASKVGFWYAYHVSGEAGLIETRVIVKGAGRTPDGKRDYIDLEVSIGEL